MNESSVEAEHIRRQSVIVSRAASRAATEPPGGDVYDAALAPLSLSAAVLHMEDSGPVQIDVVEREADVQAKEGLTDLDAEGVTDIDAPLSEIEKKQDVTGSDNEENDERRSVAAALKTETDEPSSKREDIELTSAKSSSDSAQRSVNIPGLIDSPDLSVEEPAIEGVTVEVDSEDMPPA